MNDSETRKIKKALDNIIARLSDDEYPISLDEKEYKDLLDVQKIMVKKNKKQKIEFEKEDCKKGFDNYWKMIMGRIFLYKDDYNEIDMDKIFKPPVFYRSGFNVFYGKKFEEFGDFEDHIDKLEEPFSDEQEITAHIVNETIESILKIMEIHKDFQDTHKKEFEIEFLNVLALKGLVREIKGWITTYRNIYKKVGNREGLKRQLFSDYGCWDESFPTAAGYKYYCTEQVLADSGNSYKRDFYKGYNNYWGGWETRILFLQKINAVTYIPSPLAWTLYGSIGFWALNKNYHDSDNWSDYKWQELIKEFGGNE